MQAPKECMHALHYRRLPTSKCAPHPTHTIWRRMLTQTNHGKVFRWKRTWRRTLPPFFFLLCPFLLLWRSIPSKLSSLSPAPVRCCTGSSELSFQPLNLGKIPYHAMPCHTLQYLPWPTMSMILYHPSIIHTRPLTLVVGAWWLVVGGWWLDFVR